MVVVELVVPFVPILIALVNAPVNAAVAILVVEDAPVAVDPIVNAVELANAPNVAPPSIAVVNDGDVFNTTAPLPVCVPNPLMSKSQDAAVVPEVETTTKIAVVAGVSVPTALRPED
jgi:hypothetical protein